MKIVVIGATGNVGTAVLRELKRTPEVTTITGVARRLPDTHVEPYDCCQWESVDIAAASEEHDVLEDLTRVFNGADAVIHLAWLIQPNSRRELLRRVNVEGTRRVAEAVAVAGVSHLVVASSVGAYSPDKARAEQSQPQLRDESWAIGGIDSSHYSEDKAEQERVLDEFVSAHPEITVARLRPGLVFQGDAASEIQRYFIGDMLPVGALRSGKLPALPLPKGLLLQAVHAEDVAAAYVAAAVNGAEGAFNICADDILGPQDLADILDSGRFLELPPSVVRSALVTAHATGAVPADAGWIDMSMQVPMMDTSRAKNELGWQPRHSASGTLTELFDGLVTGRGVDSPPLRSRDDDAKHVRATREPADEGTDSGDGGASRKKEKESRELLELYLSDHLTGATAGAARIERMANDFVDTPVYADLALLADDIRAERTLLANLIDDLGMKRKAHRQAAAAIGERVGRLKLNGRVLSRSPMTMLLETELMRSAVQGKVGVWETLRDNSQVLGLDPDVFQALIEGFEKQLSTLNKIHAYARIRALRDDRHTFWD